MQVPGAADAWRSHSGPWSKPAIETAHFVTLIAGGGAIVLADRSLPLDVRSGGHGRDDGVGQRAPERFQRTAEGMQLYPSGPLGSLERAHGGLGRVEQSRQLV